MLFFLLFFLLSINHFDYQVDLISRDDAFALQMTRQLINNGQFQSFQIYRPLPPLKNSFSSSPAINITARSGVVIDKMSGAILWQKNPEEVSSIASLTKLMTAIIFLETDPDFEKEYVMTKEDENGTIGSRLQVKTGEKLKIKDLFHASLVGSANNATKALVHSTGLPEEEFLKKMNERIDRLGLENTHFSDVTGLDPANKSTALEYSKIANYAFQNSKIREAVNLPEYTFETIDRKIKHLIKNTNQLLIDPDLHFIGAKTGYLNEAGYTFVLEAEQDGHPVIVVLFGSETDYFRFRETKALLDWTRQNYTWI